MLKSLQIENFRGFKKFDLNELGRINLLVGTNNSGKTSILEAIQLFYSRSNLELLGTTMKRRGEFYSTKDPNNRPTQEFEIRHLFYGRELQLDSQFSISGLNFDKLEKLTVFLTHTQSDLAHNINISFSNVPANQKTILSFSWNLDNEDEKYGFSFPLSSIFGLDEVYGSFSNLHSINIQENQDIKIQFVISSSLTIEEMIGLYERIVLFPEEKLVLEALQIIEPKIERIASVGSIRAKSSQFFFVRLCDSEQRVPIGSMGEGIWRMLGLALALVSAKGGILLIDDIDTGLHFSVMSDMWKLIWETAKKLDIQVFATTHNSDCWTSLASLANQEEMTEDDITIHRIEPGKESSIVFTKSEIVIAAERGIEVR